MKVYDYNNYNLFVIGDIHGEFKRFFNKIKSGTSKDNEIVEEDNPLVKDEFNEKKIKVKLMKGAINTIYENSIIVVSGDCGIGFNKEKYYYDLFVKYNEIFSKTNTIILFIRGNHDDPSYFNGEKINFSNIKAIPDYSVLITNNNITLCIGGAISIDRVWRKQQEAIINKYKKDYKRKLYWEDEKCVYDKDLIDEIINNNIKIDSIISHSSPKFAFPSDKPNSINWFKLDSSLKNDIEDERDTLSKIYNHLSNSNLNIKFWCHGHFHEYNVDYKNINNKKIAIISLSDDYNVISPNETLSFLELKEKSPKLNTSFKPIFFDMHDISASSNIYTNTAEETETDDMEEVDEIEHNERIEAIHRRFVNVNVEEAYERLRENINERLNGEIINNAQELANVNDRDEMAPF